jgi:K+-transporting ATPase KdpF subunit
LPSAPSSTPRDWRGCAEVIAYILAGVVALFVTIYLFVALLYPEKF